MSDQSPDKSIPCPPDLPRRGDAFLHYRHNVVYVVTGTSRNVDDQTKFLVHYLPSGLVSQQDEIPSLSRSYEEFVAVLEMPSESMDENARPWSVRRFKPLGRHDHHRAILGLSPSLPPGTALRSKVLAFALAMEEKLRRNDHKGGWADCSTDWLFERLEEEISELRMAIECHDDPNCTHYPSNEAKRVNVLHEAADAGNFLMMLADGCAALDLKVSK